MKTLSLSYNSMQEDIFLTSRMESFGSSFRSVKSNNCFNCSVRLKYSLGTTITTNGSTMISRHTNELMDINKSMPSKKKKTLQNRMMKTEFDMKLDYNNHRILVRDF